MSQTQECHKECTYTNVSVKPISLVPQGFDLTVSVVDFYIVNLTLIFL